MRGRRISITRNFNTYVIIESNDWSLFRKIALDQYITAIESNHAFAENDLLLDALLIGKYNQTISIVVFLPRELSIQLATKTINKSEYDQLMSMIKSTDQESLELAIAMIDAKRDLRIEKKDPYINYRNY